MMGICWMLVWLGVSAVGQHRGFWTAENLMASVFYGDAAIRRGLSFRTLGGTALYLLVYSLLGALFALAARERLTPLGTALVGVLVALGWYWLLFRGLGQTLMPMVWLLHAENSTAFGHVIFGAWLARFPAFLPRVEQPPSPLGPTCEIPPPDPGAS
jgi:hypothetical protein